MLRTALRYQLPRPNVSRTLRAPLSASISSPGPSRLLLSSLQYHNCRAPRSNFGVRRFHSTPRNELNPLVPLLASLLKSSVALEVTRTAGRIALTFVPVILWKNMATRRWLQRMVPDKPEHEAKRTLLLDRLRKRTILFHVLVFTPVVLFWATVLASFERTPITGRLRLIFLSPEEEDEISSQLAGGGWYQSVGEILHEDDNTPARLILPGDWRFTWVHDTLRQLESAIPVLQAEEDIQSDWVEIGPDDPPLPPPADYPLRPRPRAMEMLHRFSMSDQSALPHGIPGPPYSLLVVDKPDSTNAFSYGFGPDGGGGVVVYSGFLDDVLAKANPQSTPQVSRSEDRPWWTYLLGSSFAHTFSTAPHPVPTAEQTSELAILLAHELSHLILSHHLETLSSATVFIPGTLSMISDLLRAVIFPITMLFGPFVNDAVANLGKFGSNECAILGEYCTSIHQEIEADIVSARLLAHAGFDARDAVKFWEDRIATPHLVECLPTSKGSQERTGSPNLARGIMGTSHPLNEDRVAGLRSELKRWETERQRALMRRLAGQAAS